ncbi:hypothetical protein NJC38_18745 [Pseudomonas sp. 21LCFQ010]|uniref:hypothetical protein n=1 Tax=Pseudomonas sp. 21LCFQ010 TaxID=2957506 RepID=UPI0020977422|nr:hypothetical protein [Pseudomonas sp. 21LCFQ010]MCO8164191.1 hypothetical protein [Pseudomonas sp. 21LCFQ010]
MKAVFLTPGMMQRLEWPLHEQARSHRISNHNRSVETAAKPNTEIFQSLYFSHIARYFGLFPPVIARRRPLS